MIDLEAIKRAHPLPIVIERLVGEQPVRHKIHCPFHADKSPSLHVYDNGGWHCFGCGRSGDVLDFVGLYLFGSRYDPHQHLLEVIDRLGALGVRPLASAERPASSPRRQQPSPIRFPLARIDAWCAAMGEAQREYWRGRGLADETMRRFRLGFDGQRLTIPTLYRGVCWGVKRRAVNGEKPKYLQAQGSRVGLFNADILTQIHSGDIPLFIVEGEIEAMLLNQLGVPAISSTGGAGAWREHWTRYLAHIEHIIIVYDNDEAGRAGALRVRRSLRRAIIRRWPQGYADGGEFLPTPNAWGWVQEMLG